jgi:hypothetical protein
VASSRAKSRGAQTSEAAEAQARATSEAAMTGGPAARQVRDFCSRCATYRRADFRLIQTLRLGNRAWWKLHVGPTPLLLDETTDIGLHSRSEMRSTSVAAGARELHLGVNETGAIHHERRPW